MYNLTNDTYNPKMANRKIIGIIHKLTNCLNLYNINRSSDQTNQIVDLAIRSVLRKVDNWYSISFLLLSVNLSSIFLSLKKWSKSVLLPSDSSSIFLMDRSKKLDNRSSISFLLLRVILSGILLLLKKWLKSLLPSEISSIFL